MKSRLSYSLKEMFLIESRSLVTVEQRSQSRTLSVVSPEHLFGSQGPWLAAKLKKQEIHIFTGA